MEVLIYIQQNYMKYLNHAYTPWSTLSLTHCLFLTHILIRPPSLTYITMIHPRLLTLVVCMLVR